MTTIKTNLETSYFIPSMFLSTKSFRTSTEIEHEIYFKGKVKNTFLFRDLLMLLNDIVSARFYNPNLSRLIDPVITCEDNQLRMECFSSDASIYCRLDLSKNIFEDYENFYRGTTNVNFNQSFIEALSELRSNSDIFFEVGKDIVSLEVNSKKVKEKKVKLPKRWIKGFLEAQSIYRNAKKIFELKSIAAKKFIADCNLSMKDKNYFLVLKNNNILLMTHEPKNEFYIQVQGLSRLTLLKKIIPYINSIKIYLVEETGSTLWLIKTDGGNISFALSASIKNGFSGEGESLRSMTFNRDESLDETALEKIKELKEFKEKELANFLELNEEEVRPIIESLAISGVLGYDIEENKFFYRVLPFIEQKNNRFDSSKELLKKCNVELIELHKEENSFKSIGIVKGNSNFSYNVSIFVDKNGYINKAKCECEWFLENELKRGPCKHILALRFFSENSF